MIMAPSERIRPLQALTVMLLALAALAVAPSSTPGNTNRGAPDIIDFTYLESSGHRGKQSFAVVKGKADRVTATLVRHKLRDVHDRGKCVHCSHGPAEWVGGYPWVFGGKFKQRLRGDLFGGDCDLSPALDARAGESCRARLRIRATRGKALDVDRCSLLLVLDQSPDEEGYYTLGCEKRG